MDGYGKARFWSDRRHAFAFTNSSSQGSLFRRVQPPLKFGIILQSGYTLGVIHIGAPACGMNAAVRSFVRNCIYRGDTVVGIHDGIEGLIKGKVSLLISKVLTVS